MEQKITSNNHAPVTVRKVMEMSRFVAQLTADTTDTALPRTPIGNISLRTTYTTGRERTHENTLKEIRTCWLMAFVQLWYLTG